MSKRPHQYVYIVLAKVDKKICKFIILPCVQGMGRPAMCLKPRFRLLFENAACNVCKSGLVGWLVGCSVVCLGYIVETAACQSAGDLGDINTYE